MTALLARWTEKLAGGPQAGTSDSPPLARAMGVGRQQQPPHQTLQQSPQHYATCHTKHTLNADYLSIFTTISTRTKYNYTKTDIHLRTIGKQIGQSSLQTPRLLSRTFKLHQTYTLETLSATQTNTTSQKGRYTPHANYFQNITHNIEHRNNIRAQHASNPSISEVNSEITSLIQTHRSDIWREHIHTYWDHKHITNTLWKTIHGLANKTPTQPKNNTITFKEKTVTSPTHIANTFNNQFTNTVKLKSHKTNRHIYRKIPKLQTTNITLTTTQVYAAVKQSKNYNSTWTDKVNIKHLKCI